MKLLERDGGNVRRRRIQNSTTTVLVVTYQLKMLEYDMMRLIIHDGYPYVKWFIRMN